MEGVIRHSILAALLYTEVSFTQNYLRKLLSEIYSCFFSKTLKKKNEPKRYYFVIASTWKYYENKGGKASVFYGNFYIKALHRKSFKVFDTLVW